ncbi:MAG: 3-deoxy-manno-octulosonate cytidylyltransferase [Caulobacterales bacterium]|nr:3-deoxy-manno-octulosonate cytidylyltransferase [Caulobacterales bacterium]
MNPIVLIPARMAATRLPGKPLADIGGVPMIVRVLRQAQAAGVGPVAVAAGDPEIVQAVEAAGGRAVLTDPDLPSGSDRILAALREIDPAGAHDVVINLQGDMPFISPNLVERCAGELVMQRQAEVSTLVTGELSPDDRSNPDVVKAVIAHWPGDLGARALYFTRSVLYGEGPIWRHIGIYGYRRAALERFTATAPSQLEKREKLEQLRVLEMGMTIWAAITHEGVPISVDSPADLARARAYAKDHA